MDDWTPEEWRTWAEATKPGTYLLEKGEKVVMPAPLTPEQEAERKAQWDALWETLERRGVVRNG